MDDLHDKGVALSYEMNMTLKPRFECMCHDNNYICNHYYNYQLAKEDYFAKLEEFEYLTFNKKEVKNGKDHLEDQN